VDVHTLEGTFPSGTDGGEEALAETLGALPGEAVVLVDGLASGCNPGPLEAHCERLNIVSIMHHPLADETGLSSAARTSFADLETRALAASAGVIVTSDTTARRLVSFAVPEARTRTVRPGTEPAARARGHKPGEPPRLLSVGTVTPRKGHDVLIRALAQVRDLPWTCVCVGSLVRDPDFAAAVSRECLDADLAGRVTFAGECDDAQLEVFFDSSSIFVSASHYEGYGMAFAEALMRGLPVVGTTGGALRDTVPDDAGILVRPGDIDGLAVALRRLLDGPAERTRMAAAASRHAATLPTWDEAVDTFAAAIQDLVPVESDTVATVDL